MMPGRLTDGARDAVTSAKQHARRLGHDYLGCEHLLLGVVSGTGQAADVLHQNGLTADSVQAAIAAILGPAQPAAFPGVLDAQALASIGIDLDSVRARIEAAFGPDALALATGAASNCRPRRRGPLAATARRRHRRREARDAERAVTTRLSGHPPLTCRASRCLAQSGREASALSASHIGTEHLTLALLSDCTTTIPAILQQLDVSAPALRTAILNRIRKAS
jgi:ATP-dependent Clp protease ATP-binding subunit ClpA